MSAQVALWAAGAVLLVASAGLAAFAAWSYRALDIRGLRAELAGLSATALGTEADGCPSTGPDLPESAPLSGDCAADALGEFSFRIVARQVVTTCELGIEE